MYSMEQITRAVKSPNLICRELNRLFHRRLNYRQYNPAGEDILEKDWDILIILDACRHDMYESTNPISEDVGYIISRGSSTVEFLYANFEDRDINDTVYVTSNPQFYRHSDSLNTHFHDVINVWEDEGWDEDYGTVLPETTTNYAIEAAKQYPHKKIIIHYIQPHYPFLTTDTDFDKNHLETEDVNDGDFWNQQMEGRINISRHDIWEHYLRNLKVVFPHLKRLNESITGKKVVTSDHGNMVGDRSYPLPIKEWGHPRGLYVEPLVKVPWHIIDGSDRREIATGSPQTNENRTNGKNAKERLADLGYIE